MGDIPLFSTSLDDWMPLLVNSKLICLTRAWGCNLNKFVATQLICYTNKLLYNIKW